MRQPCPIGDTRATRRPTLRVQAHCWGAAAFSLSCTDLFCSFLTPAWLLAASAWCLAAFAWAFAAFSSCFCCFRCFFISDFDIAESVAVVVVVVWVVCEV